MLTTENGLYVWTGGYETRHTPKKAGFWWHGGECKPYCKACKAGLRLKVWWTPKREVAVLLMDLADADTRQDLKGYAEEIEASKALDDEETDIEIPAPEGREYKPFQRSGISYAARRKGALIADEMGLGKTVQALGVVNAVEDIGTVLVLCPASLRLNWKKEASNWLTGDFKIHVVEGTKDKIPDDANFVIANYESVRGRNVKSSDSPEGKVFEPSPILDQLMVRVWDMLVCDEAHRLKSRESLQTKCVLGFGGNSKKGLPPVPGIANNAERRLFLTGTPLLKRPVEIHPLVSALDPDNFGNFFSFAKRYCNARQERVSRKKTVWKFDGASNLEELQNKLRANVMVRRLKEDVLTELPPKRRQVVILPENGTGKEIKGELDAWRPHEEKMEMLRNEADFAHASGDKEAHNKALRELEHVESVAFSEISDHRRKVALRKVPKVIDHLEEMFEEGIEKVVVFGHHNDVCDEIVNHFGEEAVKLTGRVTSTKERQAAVDRFQGDPTCKVFVGSIGAAGVGHTLTAASAVVFAELDWVPANINQAEDRAHRIGKRDSLLIQHLVFDGSLDARMAELIVERQDIIDRALDSDATIEQVELEQDSGTTVSREPLPKKYPEATEAQKAAALEAMRLLAGVCDDARERDGEGFNKIDSPVGKRLAALDRLTDGQAWFAAKLAKKYRRQLPGDLISELG